MSGARGRHPAAALTLAALCSACTKPAPPAPPTAPTAEKGPAPQAEAKPKPKGEDPEPTGPAWASTTFSPRPGSVGDDRLSDLADACGAGDAALHLVAQAAAERQAETGEPMDLEEVSFELRRQGAPYVMPRMWAVDAAASDLPQLPELVEKWAEAAPLLGERRCGVGAAEREGRWSISVVAVDVLAELAPLPTVVDPGTRLDLSARLARAPTAATVVLLPPAGAPFSVDALLERNQLTARFTPTARGPWLVQIMATHVGGPRPVAQAVVTVGEDPPAGFAQNAVPGEDAFDSQKTKDDALFTLLNAARREHDLPALERNASLDRVAAQHCRAMKARGQVSHDTGAGDPARRVEEAGLRPQATGENVALAKTVPRLHRVLWASPSHRENLLLRRWDQAGVAVIEKDDGSLLATEVFIDL
jgi:uncharacterized protein YkwD